MTLDEKVSIFGGLSSVKTWDQHLGIKRLCPWTTSAHGNNPIKSLQEAVACSCISVQVSNPPYFAKRKKKKEKFQISQTYYHECDMRPFCIGDYRADVESGSATGSLASSPRPPLDHLLLGEQWNWPPKSCLLAKPKAAAHNVPSTSHV